MKPINLPPFYVGQRVVCVDDLGATTVMGTPSGLKKNMEYDVTGVNKVCCLWTITVGIIGRKFGRCSVCSGRYIPPSEQWSFNASRFAPVIEKFESISYEKVREEESKLISVN